MDARRAHESRLRFRALAGLGGNEMRIGHWDVTLRRGGGLLALAGLIMSDREQLMAMIVGMLGVPKPRFGIAPSALRFERWREAPGERRTPHPILGADR